MSGSVSDWTDGPMAPMDWQAGILPGTTQNANPDAPGVAGSAGLSLGTGTGQHGQVPLSGDMNMGNAVTETWSWINRPFTTPLDPMSIFLIVGIIMVAIVAWNLVLYHIRLAGEAI
jgi:hypothetical protein